MSEQPEDAGIKVPEGCSFCGEALDTPGLVAVLGADGAAICYACIGELQELRIRPLESVEEDDSPIHVLDVEVDVPGCVYHVLYREDELYGEITMGERFEVSVYNVTRDYRSPEVYQYATMDEAVKGLALQIRAQHG